MGGENYVIDIEYSLQVEYITESGPQLEGTESGYALQGEANPLVESNGEAMSPTENYEANSLESVVGASSPNGEMHGAYENNEMAPTESAAGNEMTPAIFGNNNENYNQEGGEYVLSVSYELQIETIQEGGPQQTESAQQPTEGEYVIQYNLVVEPLEDNYEAN
jgi:hypothetical protein